MTVFHLQHDKVGRVILDKKLQRGNTLIRTIEAQTWIDARNTIEHYEFENMKGYGYVCSEL